jgi:ATP-dependent Clp protease ATP-binding subunit ClpA
MRLMYRRTQKRARRYRPAARYLAAGAEEARRLGHTYVGTEHVLLALTRDPESRATEVLSQLGVTHATIRDSRVLAFLWAPRTDAEALASLGIDLGAVRERMEEVFGPGALERASAGGLDPSAARIQCIAPRLKQALENTVERAGEQPVRDEHVLLGMLSVSHSMAARVLADLGVSLESAEAAVQAQKP